VEGWRYRSNEPDPWLAIPPRSADALADIIGMLAAATPEQHRELAKAIRGASAVITQASQP
jgi:hypothetical protein